MVDVIDNLALINPDLLTPIPRKLAAVIGVSEMIVLLQFRGGLDTYIPTSGSWPMMDGVLKPASIEALASSEFAGREISLPKPDKALMQLRNIAMINARETQSAAEVARAFGVTRRTVINITGDRDDDDKTMDMFK